MGIKEINAWRYGRTDMSNSLKPPKEAVDYAKEVAQRIEEERRNLVEQPLEELNKRAEERFCYEDTLWYELELLTEPDPAFHSRVWAYTRTNSDVGGTKYIRTARLDKYGRVYTKFLDEENFNKLYKRKDA